MRVRTPHRAVRRRVTAVVAALVTASVLTACQGSSAKSDAQDPAKGGTLNVVLSAGPISNLDPQEISLATDANISHIINRTLTTVTSSGTLMPDLATDLGRPDATRQTWDFTLKPNLKWQDGSPLTCQDVQYGIERRFASSISQIGGLPYPMQYLADSADYTGPFLGQNLSSIVCLDTHNIEFHLLRPAGDFGYTVSVSTFAPMKASADTDHRNDGSSKSTDYDPFSDGPYQVDPTQTKIGSYVADQQTLYYASQLVLVRNKYWNPATDPARKAYPDKIVIQYDDQRTQVTNDLIQSATPFYRNAVSLDSDVTPNYVQQVVNDPTLSKRAISGIVGATRYFAINTINLPNKTCRQALEYGIDKRAWRYAAGGAIFGDLATGVIPPNLKAFSGNDIYHTNDNPDGDPNQAEQDWQHANCPKSITAAYPDTSVYKQLMATVVTAYARANIVVTPVPISTEAYYQSIGDPHNSYDIVLAGWIPDWPNGSGVIPDLFESAEVTAAKQDPVHNALGNYNYSQETDGTMQSMITQAFATDDLNEQYHLWAQLDDYQMQQAYTIPILFNKGLRMAGTNVRGGVMSPAWGEPDLSVLGVAS